MIDANSQSVIAYIAVRGSDLKEGLYLKGFVEGKTINDITRVNADQVVERDYIYGIKDGTLQRFDVDVIYATSENMYVKGLPEDGLQEHLVVVKLA